MMMKDVGEEELDSIAPQKQAGALEHRLLGAEGLPAGTGAAVQYVTGLGPVDLNYLKIWLELRVCCVQRICNGSQDQKHDSQLLQIHPPALGAPALPNCFDVNAYQMILC